MRCSTTRASVTIGLLLGAFVAISHPAQAVPVQFGSNYYEFVPGEAYSWNTANADANARSFMGVNGHLATITSQAENDFLLGLTSPVPGVQGAWLGGAVDGANQASWAVGPEGGQLVTFSNFGTGQPNEGPGNFYMNIGAAVAGLLAGQWADAAGGLSTGGNQIAGYFVEYQVGTVPLPAALPLMLTGLAGFGVVGWRRRRAMRNAAVD
jgi:hypothetical protein